MTDFTQHTIETAPEEAQALLQGIQDQYQFIPIMFGFMAEAPALLRSTLTLMDQISTTSLTPAQQQVAMLAASVENDCASCIAAHRALGKMESADQGTLDSVHACTVVVDPMDRALVDFTQSVVRSRGRQADADLGAFLEAGFTAKQAFEVILIVAYKTLTNYTNHLAGSPADPELVAMA